MSNSPNPEHTQSRSSQFSDAMIRQSNILTFYLVDAPATPQVMRLYEAALKEKGLQMDDRDQKLWQSILCSKWKLGPYDAILAVRRPDSGIRKRLIVMSAILEAQPEFADRFIPKNQSVWGWIGMGWIGISWVAALCVGAVLLKLEGTSVGR